MPPVGQYVFAAMPRKTVAFYRREAKMPPLQQRRTVLRHLTCKQQFIFLSATPANAENDQKPALLIVSVYSVSSLSSRATASSWALAMSKSATASMIRW